MKVFVIIYQYPDIVLLPNQAINMKFMVEAAAAECVAASLRTMSGHRGSPMHGAIDLVWLMAQHLEDIHFATRGPADGADVVAQHPKLGPDAFSLGHLSPDVYPPVL